MTVNNTIAVRCVYFCGLFSFFLFSLRFLRSIREVDQDKIAERRENKIISAEKKNGDEQMKHCNPFRTDTFTHSLIINRSKIVFFFIISIWKTFFLYGSLFFALL